MALTYQRKKAMIKELILNHYSKISVTENKQEAALNLDAASADASLETESKEDSKVSSLPQFSNFQAKETSKINNASTILLEKASNPLTKSKS